MNLHFSQALFLATVILLLAGQTTAAATSNTTDDRGSSCSITFIATFRSRSHMDTFLNDTSVAAVDIDFSNLVLEFHYQAAQLEEAYDMSIALMLLPAHKRMLQYGMEHVSVPTTPAATAAYQNASLITPTGVTLESWVVTIVFELVYPYASVDGHYGSDIGAPSTNTLRPTIATLLNVSEAQVHFLTQLELFFAGTGFQRYDGRKAECPYFWVVKISLRELGDRHEAVYDAAVNPSVCESIAGCVVVQRKASTDGVSSILFQEERGLQEYESEKVVFLVILVLSFFIQLILLGLMWIKSQTSGTTLMSAVKRQRSDAYGSDPTPLTMPQSPTH